MGWYELVTSLFGGGLAGLLGSIITGIINYQTKKLDIAANKDKYAHEINMKNADAAIMAQEWAARTKMAQVEGEAKVEQADAEAFGKSFDNEHYASNVQATGIQAWLLVLMDCIRGVVRPALTIYLCVLTTMLYYDAHRLIREDDFAQTDASALVMKIVNTIIFLTTTCVLWWFGTRNKAQQPKDA